MSLPTIRLKAKADRRLRAGHLWIFSNEVDVKLTPFSNFEPGTQAIVESSSGKPLGVATINPNTLICGRLVSRDIQYSLTKSFIVHKINIALALREQAFDRPFYRLIYGDSDGLPGLVVDRFGEYLVVQLSTAGMELAKDEIVGALEQALEPKGILFKNNSQSRALEGLPEYVEVASGEVPDNLQLEENGTFFLAPVRHGQKTGWFYDHRMNRARLQNYTKGKRVLDVFSYVGGWGVQAAKAGASEVVCVDSSKPAMEFVTANAELNGVKNTVETLCGDAFEVLKQLKDNGERFDIVVVDPPAFIKRRKDLTNGEQAYRRINELAIRLLEKDGILLSASCSMHLKRDVLVDILRQASRHLDRNLQVIEQGYQGPDHPVLPAIPETEYLKALFCRVTLI